MKKICGFYIVLGVLAGAFIFGGRLAYAATETESAAAYLVEGGIYEVDAQGNLNLDHNLTRAELAMYITLMEFASPPGNMEDWHRWGKDRFSDPARRYHPYTDVADSDWARPYAEYCYELGYMRGVSAELFDPQGLISPKTACTALLRFCRVPKNEINFDTSVDKARDMGLIPESGMEGETVTRGEAAEAIVRALAYYAGTHPKTTPAPLPTPEPSPVPEPTPTPVLQETYTQEELETMAQEIIRLTNAEREKAGLPALRVMSELMASSQAKARDFVENRYFEHISPVYGSVPQMIRSFGVSFVMAAENIACIDASAEGVIIGWMASEAHRNNILHKNFTHVGVGVEIMQEKKIFMCVQQFAELPK
jgi:uncharacterized protein YkwD